MKKIIAVLLAAVAVLAAGCGTTDRDVVDRNLTTDADQFNIERRIVFINGNTDKYLLSISGKCAITDQGSQLEVLCKVGDNEYKKHFLGKGDDTIYLVEQMDGSRVSRYHYEVIFRPETLVPDFSRP